MGDECAAHLETMVTEDSRGCIHVTCKEKCCTDETAECKACEMGVSVDDYCRDNDMEDCPECTSGETKTEDCNDCICVSGTWSCTEKSCNEGPCFNWCTNGNRSVKEYCALELSCGGCPLCVRKLTQLLSQLLFQNLKVHVKVGAVTVK